MIRIVADHLTWPEYRLYRFRIHRVTILINHNYFYGSRVVDVRKIIQL